MAAARPGQREDWFRSNLIAGLAIASAISLVVFPIRELTNRDPIVNLRLFRHRNFSAAPQRSCWLTRRSSASASWCRHGCSALSALPPSGRGSPQRPSASCRCCWRRSWADAHKFDLRMLATLAFVALALTSFARTGSNLDVDFDRIATAKIGGPAAGGP